MTPLQNVPPGLAPRPDDPANWSHRLTARGDAVIVPSAERGLVQPSGVFDREGRYCHDGVLWRAKPLMVPPLRPEAGEVQTRLKGTYLWGGVIHAHFGHFLLESLGRIWGYDGYEGAFDGVLFVGKRDAGSGDDAGAICWHSGETPVLNGFQQEIFTQLEIKAPIGIVTAPVEVETLVVPGQGFGMGAMAVATPPFRHFVQSRFAKNIRPEGPERLYLSRSAYGARRGGVIHEDRIEERLEQDGYTVFHPQKADLRTQIARYKAARDVVALDGSALHLLAMVARPDQNVAMIRRRSSPISKGIVDHLASFSGKHPYVIDAIKENWIRSDRKRIDRFSLAELRFSVVGKALAHVGMASEGGWHDLSADERSAAITRLNSEGSLTFRSQNSDAPAANDPPTGRVAVCHGVEVPASSAVVKPWMIRQINKGRYKKQSIAAALHLVGPDDRVLEYGAGIGYVGAVLAHNRHPQKILSVESDQTRIPAIEALYAHNKVTEIIRVSHGSLPLDAEMAALKPTVLILDAAGQEAVFLEQADLSGARAVIVAFHPDLYGQTGIDRCKERLTTAGFVPVRDLSDETFWAAERVAQR